MLVFYAFSFLASLALGSTELTHIPFNENIQVEKYERYAAAAYIKSVIYNGNWTNCCCGVCAGPLQNFTQTAYIPTNKMDTVGYFGVSHDDQEIIVSVRGSHTIMNWVTNVLFIEVPTWATLKGAFDELPLGSLLHGGFWAAYDIERDFIQRNIEDLVKTYPGYQLTLVGHSLGGAVVTLAALEYYLSHKDIPLIKIISFGQPRMGNSVFSNYMCGLQTLGKFKVIRVTNAQDIVPHLPPAALGFSHFGHELFLQKGQQVPVNCIASPNPNCGVSKQCMSTANPFDFDFKMHVNGYYPIPIQEL